MSATPMDLERLDKVREHVAGLMGALALKSFPDEYGAELVTLPGVPTSMVRDLLADRDYHAQRADEAKSDAATAAVRCLEQFDECTAFRDEVARLRARVDEAESAMAEETRRAHAMQHERDEYAADNEAWRSEALRLRARVRVEAEDVVRLGVTRAHAIAWAKTRGGYVDRLYNGTADDIAAYADSGTWRGKGGLDILDEMAAMEVT